MTVMWREGNVGGTPSRADGAGVPLGKMPPPLLAQILCLLIYQTGRCLLTFCGCHTHSQIVSLRPSPSFQKNGDHYCCRQQLFCVRTLSQDLLHLLTLLHSSLVLARGLNSPGYYSDKRLVCLQHQLLWNRHMYHWYFLLYFFCRVTSISRWYLLGII